MKLEYMAACKFCGQLVAITASEQLDDLTQQECATEKCSCDMAEEERVARDAIERLHQIGGQKAQRTDLITRSRTRRWRCSRGPCAGVPDSRPAASRSQSRGAMWSS